MANYKPEGWLIDTAENRNILKSFQNLSDACMQGKIVEGRAVVCNSEHDLIVDLGCMRGIIPKNEGAIGIAEGKAKDISIISRVNKPVAFKVTGFRKNVAGMIEAELSRRLAQEECCENYISKLRSGDVIEAQATHLEPFGCFVDIGCGISSLIPIDMISISRIAHPSDRFKVGDRLYGVVKDNDGKGKISLSHKELLGNWTQNAERFIPGETVAGIVRSVESYGIFIELAPNLAGLAEVRDDVRVGQRASVYIKSVIPEKMKIKLIIVDCFDADYENPELEYYITEGHLSNWRYSPENCSKIIETQF